MRALTCIAVVSEVERMRDVGMSVYNISEHLKRGHVQGTDERNDKRWK